MAFAPFVVTEPPLSVTAPPESANTPWALAPPIVSPKGTPVAIAVPFAVTLDPAPLASRPKASSPEVLTDPPLSVVTPGAVRYDARRTYPPRDDSCVRQVERAAEEGALGADPL